MVTTDRKEYHTRVKEAAERGYYVTLCGRLFGPRGELKGKKYGKQHCPTFSTNWGGRVYSIPIHKLAAYQWFGEDSFKEGVHVRHLDGNTENFKATNLRLGSASENEQDKPKEERVRVAKLARAAQGFTPNNAKLSDSDVREIRRLYKTLKGKKAPNGFTTKLVEKYGVSRTVITKVVKKEYYPNVKD